MSIYDYIWDKSKYTYEQKKELIYLMHLKHLEMYDYYRKDFILFFKCQKYVENIPKECIVKR